MTRRQVRVTPGFFDQIDVQFREDRGPGGQPSATDFVAYELPTIIEIFAGCFDDLPEAVPGLPAVRMHITPGVLVAAIVTYGVLADDGAIDLIGITIDQAGPV